MKLATFLAALNHSDIQALEARLGRHRYYLRRISSGDRLPSYSASLAIEKLTDGAVPRWELRPDIWKRPAASRKQNGQSRQRKARATA